MFLRKTAPDGAEHSKEYMLGFSKGEAIAYENIIFADAYISMLERQVAQLKERCRQCENCNNKCCD